MTKHPARIHETSQKKRKKVHKKQSKILFRPQETAFGPHSELRLTPLKQAVAGIRWAAVSVVLRIHTARWG